MSSLLYIGNKLSKSGNNITSIETLGSFLKNEGFTVHMASSKKNKILRLVDMLWTTLRYGPKVDVVLIDTYSTQNFYFAVSVGQLCRWLKVPYIPILRGGNLPHRLNKSPGLCRKLFDGARQNIAPSMYLFNAFKSEGYTRLNYIPNTIEINEYAFQLRKNIKAKLLWVRSFSDIYNPSLALKVVERLQKQEIPVELTMVGPEVQDNLKNCKKEAKEKNLPINFTGRLDKKDWIALSTSYDIFINTTNFDNTPVSVIEAMALGLPVISTDVGGMPYLIEHRETGILVKPNDETAFIEEIIKLMEHPAATEKLSLSARAKVESFNWAQVREQWFSVLKE